MNSLAGSGRLDTRSIIRFIVATGSEYRPRWGLGLPDAWASRPSGFYTCPPTVLSRWHARDSMPSRSTDPSFAFVRAS
jgi:hypothetical protein